tara:strand:+ start:3080 stop:4117 length:1038 start_codon:yes stop_codon:yes gene_type:complete
VQEVNKMISKYSVLFFSIFIFCFCLIFAFSFIYKKIYSKTNLVTTLAGPCIFISFIIFSFLNFKSIFLIFNNTYNLVFFYMSTLLIVIMGVIDDFVKIDTFKKIIFQIFIIILSINGLSLDQVIIFPFFNNYIINYIFLVIFILGIMNSINLIDGIDNIAALLSIVISIFFIILSNVIGFNVIDVFFYMIIGCLLSYLLYNNFISRIFLGDAGSLFIGWLFAIVSILFINFSNKVIIDFPFIFLFIPAFDVIYVMIYRFFNSNNKNFLVRIKNIFNPDKTHIHYSLLRTGMNNFLVCFVLCAILFIVSLLYVKYIFYFNVMYKYIFINVLFLIYVFTRIKVDKLI